MREVARRLQIGDERGLSANPTSTAAPAIGILLVVLSGAVLLSVKMLASWRSSSSTSPSPFARTRSASA